MPTLKEIETDLRKALKVEEILKGENPSPEKAKAAEKVALDHFKHLVDLDAPKPDRPKNND